MYRLLMILLGTSPTLTTTTKEKTSVAELSCVHCLVVDIHIFHWHQLKHTKVAGGF